MLYLDFNISIKDPLWNNIFLNKGLYNIFKSKSFQKLHNIKQLGPTYLSYPSATHTRASHSLGVFHMAKKLITALIKNSEDLNLTKKGVLSFLCAALLHDIGHFPYAHSLKDIISKSHEERATDIILNDEEICSALENDLGIVPLLVCEIIDFSLSPSNSEIQFYRNLLSASIDPDKLDYLCRDAYFCGVPYGIQDTSYIFDHLNYFDGEICIDEKSASSVYQILFSKYMMYKSVYWNDTVRSATAMIKQAIYLALQEGLLEDNDLFDIGDNGLIQIQNNMNFEPYSLIQEVQDNNLYKPTYNESFDSSFDRLKLCSDDYILRLEISNEIFDALFPKYKKLLPFQIIIDIPENINFETDIFILSKQELIPYCDQNALDLKPLLKELRKIRIFTPDYIREDDLNEVLKEICQR